MPRISGQGRARPDPDAPGRNQEQNDPVQRQGPYRAPHHPLIGKQTVKGFTSTDAKSFQRDVIAGKSAADVKTKTRGRAHRDGRQGTAARTMGLLGGIFSYAVSEGYRPDNPVSGIRRPKDRHPGVAPG